MGCCNSPFVGPPTNRAIRLARDGLRAPARINCEQARRVAMALESTYSSVQRPPIHLRSDRARARSWGSPFAPKVADGGDRTLGIVLCWSLARPAPADPRSCVTASAIRANASRRTRVRLYADHAFARSERLAVLEDFEDGRLKIVCLRPGRALPVHQRPLVHATVEGGRRRTVSEEQRVALGGIRRRGEPDHSRTSAARSTSPPAPELAPLAAKQLAALHSGGEATCLSSC